MDDRRVRNSKTKIFIGGAEIKVGVTCQKLQAMHRGEPKVLGRWGFMDTHCFFNVHADILEEIFNSTVSRSWFEV
jgi:hypothetical protein